MAVKWKTPIGFPNYSISDSGEVINLTSRLHLTPMKQRGKLHVQLTDKYKCRKTISLAVAVYELFSGKFTGTKSTLIYLDGDPYNCKYSNLKLISRSENLSRLKGLTIEKFTLEQLFEKMKKCDGFISDISQFSAGNLTIVENCETVQYFKEKDLWRKIV